MAEIFRYAQISARTLDPASDAGWRSQVTKHNCSPSAPILLSTCDPDALVA